MKYSFSTVLLVVLLTVSCSDVTQTVTQQPSASGSVESQSKSNDNSTLIFWSPWGSLDNPEPESHPPQEYLDQQDKLVVLEGVFAPAEDLPWEKTEENWRRSHSFLKLDSGHRIGLHCGRSEENEKMRDKRVRVSGKINIGYFVDKNEISQIPSDENYTLWLYEISQISPVE